MWALGRESSSSLQGKALGRGPASTGKAGLSLASHWPLFPHTGHPVLPVPRLYSSAALVLRLELYPCNAQN